MDFNPRSVSSLRAAPGPERPGEYNRRDLNTTHINDKKHALQIKPKFFTTSRYSNYALNRAPPTLAPVQLSKNSR